jgi:hypothetical protein
VQVGLARSGECVDRGVDDGRVEVGAGRVAGAGVVDGAVSVGQQAHHGWRVVEVDDGRGGAAGRDGLGLGVVADEGRDVVAVLDQFGEYVRSDEAGRAGECHVHLGESPCVDGQSVT